MVQWLVMKRQEIKWISRDDDGTYTVEPEKIDGKYGCAAGSCVIQRAASPWERLGITLGCGGLAEENNDVLMEMEENG